jgi:hypothetical protein
MAAEDETQYVLPEAFKTFIATLYTSFVTKDVSTMRSMYEIELNQLVDSYFKNSTLPPVSRFNPVLSSHLN